VHGLPLGAGGGERGGSGEGSMTMPDAENWSWAKHEAEIIVRDVEKSFGPRESVMDALRATLVDMIATKLLLFRLKGVGDALEKMRKSDA
jgi:hypothetical protein